MTPTNTPGAREALLRDSADTEQEDAVMGDAADETKTDEPDDLPDAEGPAVTVAHAAESLIASQMESQQAKLAVFRAFCTAFDQTAAQFTSGHALSFAKDISRDFISYWDVALNGVPTRAGKAHKSMAQTGGPLRQPRPTAPGGPLVQPPKDDQL
ncbi:hypothetical protein HRG_000760 [Hirsutella rhossiliensis]|uniref:Uncharacterized protein n=1 Tax=Hirsutella rhossiliensis TaxID=111463 RepID=A0A9P8SM22_9HYPO|nr:uncharacterized protein HRG_00760 [Hirsutella rhossiliensis]KAH0968118.1 hypothetical protein HRG_00760 [Hirsutella rhossiliensis]